MAEINNDIKDYINGMIFKYDFSQKYNAFINNFDKFERIHRKKKKGAISVKQKELMKLSKGYLLFLQGLNREKD